MRTQKHDLKDEIKRLDICFVSSRTRPRRNNSFINQSKRLDDAKSTLINIQ